MHPRYTYPSIDVIILNPHRSERYRQQYRNHPTIFSAPAVQLPRCPVHLMRRKMLVASFTVRVGAIPSPETPRLEPVQAGLDCVPPMSLNTPHPALAAGTVESDDLESSTPPTPSSVDGEKSVEGVEKPCGGQELPSISNVAEESSTMPCGRGSALQTELVELRLLLSSIPSTGILEP